MLVGELLPPVSSPFPSFSSRENRKKLVVDEDKANGKLLPLDTLIFKVSDWSSNVAHIGGPELVPAILNVYQMIKVSSFVGCNARVYGQLTVVR